MHEPIRVLVVDDHLVFAQALRTALSVEPDLEVVGIATNGLEASAEAKRTEASVVLMDYSLPGVDGATATRGIKELTPAAQVIMLTSYGERAVLMESLKAGVSGFLSKERAIEDVVAAVRRAAAGEIQVPAGILTALLGQIEADGAEGERGVWKSGGESPEGEPTMEALTPRELEILRCFSSGAEQQAVAEQLGISPHTVRTHAQRIFEKLSVHSKLEAVSVAIRRGLIPPPF